MTTTPVLNLLSERSKWTQGAWAKNKDGIGTLPNDPASCCWCLSGALIKCYPDEKDYYEARIKIEDILRCRGIGPVSIYIFNDRHTYEQVLDLAKEAQV